MWNKLWVNIKKHQKKLGILFIVFCFFLFWGTVLLRQANRISNEYAILVQSTPVATEPIELDPGETISYHFQLPGGSAMQAFSFLFTEVNETRIVDISLFQQSDGRELHKWTLSDTEIQREGFTPFILDSLIEIQRGETYSLHLENKGEGKVILLLSGEEAVENALQKNGQNIEGVPMHQILSERKTYVRNFVLLGIVGAAILFSLAVVLCFKKVRLEKGFVLVSFVSSLLLMFIITPHNVPDEFAHFVSAYEVSSKVMGQNPYNEDGVFLIRQADLEYYNNWQMGINRSTINFFMSGLEEPLTEEGAKMVPWGGAVDRTPIFVYAPQVLGISLGRAIHLNAAQLFMFTRFCTLLLYTALVYFAVKIIPIGKMVIIAVALFPMTMQQSMGVSYDALAIGLSFLFISWVFRLAYESKRVRWWDIIVLTVIAAWLAPIKVVYIVLIFLGLFIPYEKFGGKLKKLTAAGILTAGGAGAILFSRLSKIGAVMEIANDKLRWIDAPSYSLEMLLSNPVNTVKIFFNTLIGRGDYYFLSSVGSLLGWLNIGIPAFLLFSYVIIFLLSSQHTENIAEHHFLKKERAIFLFISIAVFVGFGVTMLIAWTPAGYSMIEGMQGRYLLPVLPLVAFALQSKSLVWKKNMQKFLLSALTFLNIFLVFWILRSAV